MLRVKYANTLIVLSVINSLKYNIVHPDLLTVLHKFMAPCIINLQLTRQDESTIMLQ